ncbi:MAG: hypothetical protein SV062_03395 [Thermodesulfobacteriota bacterium]|nr:hypothetical protein [Thermodesulfobacteriota bacterium]
MNGFLREPVKGKVTLTANIKQPLVINEIKSYLKEKITYKLTTLEKDRKYEIEIINNVDVPGRYYGNFDIYTNYEKSPKIRIFISGNIKGEVNALPSYVYFGTIKTESMQKPQKKRQIRIKSVRGLEELIIKEVICNVSFIKTKLIKGDDGNYKLILELKRDELIKGKFRGEIIVKTNNKISPEVIIKISGEII